MSRFADKLKNALQVAPPSMGFFRSTSSADKPRMLLVARLTLEDAENASDVMKSADAVLLTCHKYLPAKTLKMLLKTAGDAPLGVWFIGKAQSKVPEGVDFEAFAAENTLLSRSSTGIGKVLVLPSDLPDSFARALNDLPMDSILVDADTTAALTWMDLMRWSRLGDFITKPLLAHVPVDISGNEITMLWDGGVDALVVSVSAESGESFNKLRAVADELKLAPKRKWMKTSAIVPVVKQDAAAFASDDDDADDDD
ncbi:MAG: hypothetical protein FWF98_00750 [Dehalococcoidia bacterium]|nr:hypothetical protein [Dehalococcoidia bacterium]